MVFGRFTDAVSDLSETLRRVFRDPPSHALDTGLKTPRSRGAATLAVEGRRPDYEPHAVSVPVPVMIRSTLVQVETVLQGRIQAEEGWSQWAQGAKVLEMPVFQSGGQRRVEVPPLPRRPLCRRIESERFRTSCRSYREAFNRPAVRGGSPELASAVGKGGLDHVLSFPIAIQGRDVQTLPKAQWMRYSLQLVKSTGENIRNLEVLGLYWVPSRGVGGMRHDAKSGRLLLELSREAAGAARSPLLLARRRDDRTLVSCFLEEG